MKNNAYSQNRDEAYVFLFSTILVYSMIPFGIIYAIANPGLSSYLTCLIIVVTSIFITRETLYRWRKAFKTHRLEIHPDRIILPSFRPYPGSLTRKNFSVKDSTIDYDDISDILLANSERDDYVSIISDSKKNRELIEYAEGMIILTENGKKYEIINTSEISVKKVLLKILNNMKKNKINNSLIERIDIKLS